MKLYGTKPIRLTSKINKNNTETNGKYFSPSILRLSNNNCETVSYTVSIKVCQLFGIKKKVLSSELIKEIRVLNATKTIIFTKNKLVNEKSKLNNFIEKKEII